MRGRVGNTNLGPPNVGAGPPVYPRRRQLVQVLRPAFSENGYTVYLGAVIQYSPSAGLRQREQVYVAEANRQGLAAGGFYRAVLAGAYPPPERGPGSLPLLWTSTACCVTLPGPPSSSSASPRSSSPRSPSSSSAAPLEPLGCCPGVLFPTTLYATVSSPDCPCVDAVVVPLTFGVNIPGPSGIFTGWFGSGPISGCPARSPDPSGLGPCTVLNVALYTSSSACRFDFQGVASGLAISTSTSNLAGVVTCSPLELQGTVASGWSGTANCCAELNPHITVNFTQ